MLQIQCLPSPLIYSRRRTAPAEDVPFIADEDGNAILDQARRKIGPDSDEEAPPEEPSIANVVADEDGGTIRDEAAREVAVEPRLNAPTNLRLVSIVDNGNGTFSPTIAWDDTNTDPDEELVAIISNGDVIEEGGPGATSYTNPAVDYGEYIYTVKVRNVTLGIESEPSNELFVQFPP